jgi:hypothetical protein
MLLVMVAASAIAWLIFGVLLKNFRGIPPQNLREEPSEPS